VHNTHLSLKNVMVEQGTDALRLIDLEAFTVKDLDPRDVLRMHRRLARIMAHMLADGWPGIEFGPEEKEVARLDLWMAHHRMPRGKAPPLEGDHFESLHEIHRALRHAMVCAARTAPVEMTALRAAEHRPGARQTEPPVGTTGGPFISMTRH
jgi:hypothetical protein